MQRLRVRMDGLPQLRQRLVARLGEQSQVQRGELLEVTHVLEQRPVLPAVLVNEGHRWGGWARSGHG